MQAFVLISIGGILGANVRYLISTWAASRFGTDFPYGTLIVNVAGSLLIGFIVGVLMSGPVDQVNLRLLIVTGFLGAETTFSTFAYETVALLRFGDLRDAARNVIANVALGLGATAVGLVLAIAVTRTGW
jgi:CrcB protein